MQRSRLAIFLIAAACSAAPEGPRTPILDPPPTGPPVWLRGSTHVHAAPSFDSSAPIPDVIRWYETRGYDFIVLTDHNRVSEVDRTVDSTGKPHLRDPSRGLIVLAGVELTESTMGCSPPGDRTGKCRIHVNLIGATARPRGEIDDWIDRTTNDRAAKYKAAASQAARFGGIPQLNHPQLNWGMTTHVLTKAASSGIVLYEVWNAQVGKWNAGDADHPSTEALWDAALGRGATLWGVASDDAHHYDGGGEHPPGGGWVMVRAARHPQAIVDALRRGEFYASTGVTLARAEVEDGALVVEIATTDPADAIVFVDNGKRIVVPGKQARHPLPATGYVRAVVERGDAKAWVQPARR